MKKFLALVLPVALPFALVLGACGDDGDDSNSGRDEDPTAERGEGEIPDPCTLIPEAELAFYIDGEPGEGSEQAPAPDQRRICTYESGLILSVEIADNWDPSLAVIREMAPDSLVDVPGIGEEAVWQELGGGAGQFLALNDDLFVGVTVSSGGQEVGQFIAEAMLAAL